MPRLLTHRRTYWLAVILLLLAALLRFFDLSRLPYGANADEIDTIAQALQVREGSVSLFLQATRGPVEAAYPSLLSLMTVFWGDGLFGFRLLAPWLGVLTVALVLTLGMRLYGRLTGLVAAGLMSLAFASVLLSRLIVVEQVLPLIVTVTMLALARALPVYQQARPNSTSIPAYALLGIILSLALYVHPLGLPLMALAMLFIAYVVVTQRPLSRQQLSLLGFALLLMTIVGIPYLLTSLRAGTLALNRLADGFVSLQDNLQTGLAFLFGGTGDLTYSLPNGSLLHPALMVLLGLGLWRAWQQRQQPRFVLLVLILLGLLPFAFLQPNLTGLATLLPPLALLMGVGVQVIADRLPQSRLRALGFGLLVLLALGLAWRTTEGLRAWRALPEVQALYQTPAAQVARYLDAHGSDLPTSFCYPQMGASFTIDNIPPAALVLLFLNNQQVDVSLFDCSSSLLLRQGGERQRVVLPTSSAYEQLPRYLQGWLKREFALHADDVPPNVIYELDASALLAQKLGEFMTTTSAQYAIEAGEFSGQLVPPPVRLGGNVTWMGYVSDDGRIYRPGDHAQVITYWRVDGELPPDLMLFNHLLIDSVTIASQRDLISVNVGQLRPRDVFIQVTAVPILPTMLPGIYTVSIGAYQSQTGARLPVFDEQAQRRGDRLLLYPITVGNN
ncbi:MAG: phospholipid carrier-dependent glycosyltransferase [Anaerolineae bacterium]|nr:phospholipid carrier-dependent glycosyltransferase [Anaerolineae bacterium]MDW8173421.1 phospholipid carrier-dependent glycosyltransferase [Anaerolineae bacterium]